MKRPAPQQDHTRSSERGTPDPTQSARIRPRERGQPQDNGGGPKRGADNGRRSRPSSVPPVPSWEFLSDQARVLIRWMSSEKNIAMSELSRLVGYSGGHLRKVLRGEEKVELRRHELLVEAVVSPWFIGTRFDALHGADLHHFDERLLSPVATAGVLDPSVPPRSHVGLDGAVLLASASSDGALDRQYPWTTKCSEVLRQLSLPNRGGTVSAVIRRHYKDRPDAADETHYALRYAARFDVQVHVPGVGDPTLAVLRVWPKNRRLFSTAHDIHVKLNGSAFRLGVAVPLLHALLSGVASPGSISVHSLDVALDVEAPYGALAAFQSRCLPGVGYFAASPRMGTQGPRRA